MKALKPKDVWMEVNVITEPISDYRVVKFDHTAKGYILQSEIKKQSLFCFTEEELRELLTKMWEQSDKTAEEFSQYKYGRNGGYQNPDQQTFINNLFTYKTDTNG